MVAVVTLGNTPNTDILCSNVDGTKFAHIQVKTFVPGNRTCSVGKKAEINYGKIFVWVLCGIPNANDNKGFEFFIIPSKIMAEQVLEAHQLWLQGRTSKGKRRKDSNVRTLHIPPYKNYAGWSIEEFRNRWDIIEELL